MARAAYGFTPEEWQSMVDRARELLAEVAREHRTITYGDLAALVADHRISPRSGALVALLGEVCETEDSDKGIMLGSVVVRADSGIPGQGYFRHAEGLGRDVSDPEAFWHDEVERVWHVFADGEAC